MGITYSFPKDVCNKLLQYMRRKAKLSKVYFKISFEVYEATKLGSEWKVVWKSFYEGFISICSKR